METAQVKERRCLCLGRGRSQGAADGRRGRFHELPPFDSRPEAQQESQSLFRCTFVNVLFHCKHTLKYGITSAVSEYTVLSDVPILRHYGKGLTVEFEICR